MIKVKTYLKEGKATFLQFEVRNMDREEAVAVFGQAMKSTALTQIDSVSSLIIPTDNIAFIEVREIEE